MAYALFIHGLHSDKDSSTGQQVTEILKKHGITVITESFDVLNYDKTMKRIEELKHEYLFSYIVGHSLGGFYALMCGLDGFIICINPCLKPEIEIPKLLNPGEVLTEEQKNRWIEAREYFWNYVGMEEKAFIHGIFAKDDPLFSYADFYSKEFRNLQMIEGEHKVSTEELSLAINNIFDQEFESYRRNPKGLSFPPFEMDDDDKLIAYYNRSQYGNPEDCPELKQELEAKGIPTSVAEYKTWYINWLRNDFRKKK